MHLNWPFLIFFRTHGVVSLHSCVETPQQNFVVEWKHQHILNVAPALFFQSKLPLAYWTDCIVTTVYLINRSPSPLLSNKTHFELIWHKKPSYSHIKAFGLSLTRTQFSTYIVPCVFLGYRPCYKGYKLLDLSTNTVFISRDVIFHESIFPLCSYASQTSTADIFFFFFIVFSLFLFILFLLLTPLLSLPRLFLLLSQLVHIDFFVLPYIFKNTTALFLPPPFLILILYHMFLATTNCLLPTNLLFMLFLPTLNRLLIPRQFLFCNGKRLCLSSSKHLNTTVLGL